MKIPSILKRRSFLIGLVLVGAVAVAAGLADVLAPFDPVKNNYRYRMGEPNDIYLLGTDRFGRDVLSRIYFGARVSLRIGKASIKPKEITPIFELSINESTNLIRFSLCTFRGIISVIKPCNCNLILRLDINGKLGIRVNKNRKEGGMAMMKL